MKCHYCLRNYKDLYIQQDEVIPVCGVHLKCHIESDQMIDEHDPFEG